MAFSFALCSSTSTSSSSLLSSFLDHQYHSLHPNQSHLIQFHLHLPSTVNDDYDPHFHYLTHLLLRDRHRYPHSLHLHRHRLFPLLLLKYLRVINDPSYCLRNVLLSCWNYWNCRCCLSLPYGDWTSNFKTLFWIIFLYVQVSTILSSTS
jgi:hypothetical protein